MNGAGHHVRAKIQNPIIGVLTQPVHPGADDDLWTDEMERIQKRLREEKTVADGWNDETLAFPKKQYIEASHVKMLESSGARTIPLDFTLDIDELKALLEQINGLYIPGDSSRLITPHQEYDYTK